MEFPRAERIDTAVELRDVFFTVADILGLPVGEQMRDDVKKKSLRSVCRAGRPEHRTENELVYSETEVIDAQNNGEFRSRLSSLQDGDWKFIYDVSSNSYELYNLKDDPLEEKNVGADYPELARKYLSIIAQYGNVKLREGDQVLPTREFGGVINKRLRDLGYLE
jgi:arylsulfatase A-like enzyme